jgi:hypothetical protein
MGGEAGFLARHVSKGANMNVGFMSRSLPNQSQDFKQALAGRPGINILDLKGAHTSGMREDILEMTKRRMSGLILQLALGVKPDELDYSLVHLAEAA